MSRRPVIAAAWSSVSRLLAGNPVLVKEGRTRMRGARAYWILGGYLTLLALVMLVQYASWWSRAQEAGGWSIGERVGQDMLTSLVIAQALLVLFITPAITSGAITLEREQRTLEMLEMTRLSRISIVLGKLLSASGFVMLLVLSSLPLASLCFVLGGVSPERIAHSYLMLLGASLATGAMGMAWSSVARSTSTAVSYSYGTLLAPMIVVPMLLGAVVFSSNVPGLGMCGAILTGLFGVFSDDITGGGSSVLGQFVEAWDARLLYGVGVPTWLGPIATYGLVTALLVAVAANRLELRPERSAVAVRLLALAVLLHVCIYTFGGRFGVAVVLGSGSALAADPVLPALLVPLVFVVAAAPAFATGDVARAQARSLVPWLLRGWTPVGLRRGDIASALPFLMACVVVVVGAYLLSFVAVGRPEGILTGHLATAAHAGSPGPLGGLVPVVVVTVASLFSIWAVGVAASLITGNRWVAAAIVYFLVAFSFAAPTVATAAIESGNGGFGSGLLANLHYLNPALALLEQVEAAGKQSPSRQLMFGPAPLWLVGTVAHLLVALVAGMLAVPFIARAATRPDASSDRPGPRRRPGAAA